MQALHSECDRPMQLHTDFACYVHMLQLKWESRYVPTDLSDLCSTSCDIFLHLLQFWGFNRAFTQQTSSNCGLLFSLLLFLPGHDLLSPSLLFLYLGCEGFSLSFLFFQLRQTTHDLYITHTRTSHYTMNV